MNVRANLKNNFESIGLVVLRVQEAHTFIRVELAGQRIYFSLSLSLSAGRRHSRVAAQFWGLV